MLKAERLRVQGLAAKPTDCGDQFERGLLWQTSTRAIGRITNQWITGMRHMDPDLMRATGMQFGLYAGVRSVPFIDPDTRVRSLAIIAHGLTYSVMRIAADGFSVFRTRNQITLHKGHITAVHPPLGQRFDQTTMCTAAGGHHHDAARFLVQPVHDACARQLSEFRSMGKQRIHQRPIWIARARMNDEPGGFGQDDDVLILVQDIERDRLRCVIDDRYRWLVQTERFTPFQAQLGFDRRAIHGQSTLFDGASQHHPGMIFEQYAGDAIGAFASQMHGYLLEQDR